MAAGDGVDVVPVGDMDEVVGRVAASDLHEGSLLVEADLFPRARRSSTRTRRSWACGSASALLRWNSAVAAACWL